MADPRTDVIIVGGGHNGLTAAVLLSKRGLKVTVVERRDMLGGACVTEQPFAKAPDLKVSTGAYLLGMMPPELLAELDLGLTLNRRDPHYFLPTTSERYLLFGSDEASLERQFRTFFSDADWQANRAMNAEIAALRDDLAPSWMMPPMSLEATAERFIRPALRRTFVDMCRGSARQYLDRFGFKSDLLKAMYAVTDGFAGLDAGYDTPGVGFNLLAHNMCRLPGSGGGWMIVSGGTGAITQAMARQAKKHGATLRTGSPVKQVLVEKGVAKGVELENGESIRAQAVIINADPFRAMSLFAPGTLPKEYLAKIDNYRTDGTTMKVNMALSALPKFTCLPENKGQFGPTIHLLPDEKVVLKELERSYADTKNGRLPEFPSIEWYFHTTIDKSLQDSAGHHNSALFVQWVPYALSGGKTWEQEESRYVKHLLSICDRFAPGFSDLVVDTFVLTPPKIESHFGITKGHIHHVDNKFYLDQRLPYATPVEGAFFCSAGCHPGGGVIGASGYNAANTVLKAMGKA